MGLSMKDKIRTARQLAAQSQQDRDEIQTLVDEFVSDSATADEEVEKPKKVGRKKPGPKPGSKRKSKQTVEEVATDPPAAGEDDAVDAAIKGLSD